MAVVASALAYTGCDSAVDEKIALARLGQSCLVNTDCANPLACAFELCHAECRSSRDCDGGARCVAAARPYKVCQLEDERFCKRTADCPEGLICGIDGECRDSCQADSDCVEGQVCVSGTCADKNELDEAGQLAPAPGMSSGSEGAPCVYVSDCSGTLLCRGQACLPECRADKDCGAHQICQDARCVDDGTQPQTCSYNSDCDTAHGQRCLSGGCRCSCVEDRDCPASQVCDGCGCVTDPAAKSECVYTSDCSNPGEICRAGACSCQCKQDLDCGAGQKCDGCGCVTDPIPTEDGTVLGDVELKSALQLPLYRGVKSVVGELVINAPGLTDFGDTFDQLESVTGRLEVNAPVLTRLAFPELKSVGRAIIIGVSPRLESLELPALVAANVVNINSAPRLKTLLLTNYEDGSIDISAGLSDLSLPALQHAPTLSLHDTDTVQTLSAPVLLDVGYVNLNNLVHLAEANAPMLKAIGVGNFMGEIRIQSTGLTSLAGLFGTIVANLEASPENKTLEIQRLTIQSNAALSQCLVDDFSSKVKTSDSSNTTGNKGCP